MIELKLEKQWKHFQTWRYRGLSEEEETIKDQVTCPKNCTLFDCVCLDFGPDGLSRSEDSVGGF